MNLFPKLYHYTNLEGLLGMAQSKSIWMTNIRYMNDIGEFNYGLKVVREYIQKKHPGIVGNSLDEENVGYQKIPSLFSFSLSENKDLLSQWRGYCPLGGCSVSFDSTNLQNFVDSNGLTLKACLYDLADIKILIEEIIDRCSPKKYQDQSGVYMPSKGYDKSTQNLIDSLFYHIPFIKHDSFKEEKEWRIIRHEHYQRPIAATENVKYRVAKNKIIPYLQYDFKDIVGYLIDGAILSPNDPDDLAIEALRLTLKLAEGKVIYSEIPYRGS